MLSSSLQSCCRGKVAEQAQQAVPIGIRTARLQEARRLAGCALYHRTWPAGRVPVPLRPGILLNR